MKRSTKSLEILILNVAARLQDIGLSKSEFAQRMGMTPNRVSVYLSGKHSPGLEAIDSMAEALGLSVSDLLRNPGGNKIESEQIDPKSAMELLEALGQSVENLRKENEKLRAAKGQLNPELTRLVVAYLQANPLVRAVTLAWLTRDEKLSGELARIVGEQQRFAALARESQGLESKGNNHKKS